MNPANVHTLTSAAFARLERDTCRLTTMSISFFDAIKQGNRYEVERQLIVDPTLVHVKENGLSPILIAAYYHEPALASFLADKTVILTIFEAAATGKINHVIRLLARDPESVNAYAQDGFQPLGL